MKGKFENVVELYLSSSCLNIIKKLYFTLRLRIIDPLDPYSQHLNARKLRLVGMSVNIL